MNNQFCFISSLAGQIVQFITFKRMQGYVYTQEISCLKRFDSFLAEKQFNSTVLSTEDLNCYCADTVNMKAGTRAQHLSAVRQLSLYLHAVDHQSAVLPKHIQPRSPRSIRFYPLAPEEVGQLMKSSDILSLDNFMLVHCIRFLIGLLYSTGLRIGEALNLDIQDVNMKNSTIFVRPSKFRKERIVPMSSSTLDAVKIWFKRREEYAGSETAVLITKYNQRLYRKQASSAFRRLCIHCGFIGETPPRIHDLRHNYACRCIALWREAQEDVNALLPVLANAMGHVNFFATQIYIHIDAASLQQASAKFNAHITHSLENSK